MFNWHENVCKDEMMVDKCHVIFFAPAKKRSQRELPELSALTVASYVA